MRENDLMPRIVETAIIMAKMNVDARIAAIKLVIYCFSFNTSSVEYSRNEAF